MVGLVFQNSRTDQFEHGRVRRGAQRPVIRHGDDFRRDEHREGQLQPGERVVDVGSGAGIDSLIAAKMVAPDGLVIGIDMTEAMLEMARKSSREAGSGNAEFREGLAESLPVPDGWADVVISNGVLNLVPDKLAALQEMARVLKHTGRLQIGDILVQQAVPEDAKEQIDLWTG